MPSVDDIPYTVQLSPRARRCRVQVGLDGVLLIVPRRMPVARAEEFLRSQTAWLKRHLARRRRMIESLPPGTMMYRGLPTPVRIVEIAVARPQARREEGGFTLYAPRGRAGEAAALLERTLRREAAAALAEEVAAQAERTGLRPQGLSIRDQRSRWGSCSHRGHLSLNWRLILAPPEVLSYVVIHELAHLAEANHGPRFWALVTRHCPDYELRRRWLKQHGTALHRPIPTA